MSNKPDFWEGYVPEPDKRQQALDKKAENARELGLDYEPAQQEPVACKTLCELCVKRGYIFCANASQTTLIPSPPAQQEPVAVTYKEVWDAMNALYAGDLKQIQIAIEMGDKKLIPSPPAQRTWVGLTDEQIEKVREKTFSTGNPYCPVDSKSMRKAARAIEAKLKEKNT